MSATGAIDDPGEPATVLAPEPALRARLDASLPGRGPFTVERITTGMSHELFRLSRSGGSWVLRRPPGTAHPSVRETSIEREFRVLRALDASEVPHPQALVVCTDLDVIGAPFLVMEEIIGVRLYDGLVGGYARAVSRAALGPAMIDALSRLHRFEWKSVLDGFGRPDGFTARQVDRWLSQLQSFGVRSFPGLDEAAQWLRAHVPVMSRACLIHGDFGLHNVLFSPEPTELLAVLDWETSTIGDPLMDVGYFLSMWLQESERATWHACALPYDVTGFTGHDQLAERYSDSTGIDISTLGWYEAMAQIKMAAMLEGGYVRHLQAGTGGETIQRLRRVVPNHVEYAIHLVARTASRPR